MSVETEKITGQKKKEKKMSEDDTFELERYKFFDHILTKL